MTKFWQCSQRPSTGHFVSPSVWTARQWIISAFIRPLRTYWLLCCDCDTVFLFHGSTGFASHQCLNTRHGCVRGQYFCSSLLVAALLSNHLAKWAFNVFPITSLQSRSNITCSLTFYRPDLMPPWASGSKLLSLSSRKSSINVSNSVATKSFMIGFTSLAITCLLLLQQLSVGLFSDSTGVSSWISVITLAIFDLILCLMLRPKSILVCHHVHPSLPSWTMVLERRVVQLQAL